MKPIRLTKHARGYVGSRGFTLAEVKQAIRESQWRSTQLGRLECDKEFPFGKDWNGKRYAIKQVRPVFVEETSEIVVVTVYVFYYQGAP